MASKQPIVPPAFAAVDAPHEHKLCHENSSLSMSLLLRRQGKVISLLYMTVEHFSFSVSCVDDFYHLLLI